MFDAVSFAEIDEQQVELLPARTVLSALDGGVGAPGADSTGGIGAVIAGIPIGDASVGR